MDAVLRAMLALSVRGALPTAFSRKPFCPNQTPRRVFLAKRSGSLHLRCQSPLLPAWFRLSLADTAACPWTKRDSSASDPLFSAKPSLKSSRLETPPAFGKLRGRRRAYLRVGLLFCWPLAVASPVATRGGLSKKLRFLCCEGRVFRSAGGSRFRAKHLGLLARTAACSFQTPGLVSLHPCHRREGGAAVSGSLRDAQSLGVETEGRGDWRSLEE